MRAKLSIGAVTEAMSKTPTIDKLWAKLLHRYFANTSSDSAELRQAFNLGIALTRDFADVVDESLAFEVADELREVKQLKL